MDDEFDDYDNGPVMGRKPRHASDAPAKPDPGAEGSLSHLAPPLLCRCGDGDCPYRLFLAGYRAGQEAADESLRDQLRLQRATIHEKGAENAALKERVEGEIEAHRATCRELERRTQYADNALVAAEQRAEKMEKALEEIDHYGDVGNTAPARPRRPNCQFWFDPPHCNCGWVETWDAARRALGKGETA